MPLSGTTEREGLRRQIAAIEARTRLEAGDGPASDDPHLSLGIEPVDAVLGGGLALGAMHEASAAQAGLEGAVTGFALCLAAQAARQRRRPVLAVQPEATGRESGWLYGPGLAAAGLPEGALILVRVRRMADILLVMEEALKCGGLAAVLGEMAGPVPDALTATRRLALAAQSGGGLGLLVRMKPDPAPCAAQTRWMIAPALSLTGDGFGGLGWPSVRARLVRNRRGPPGAWRLDLKDSGPALAERWTGGQREIGRWDSDNERDRPAGAPLSQPVAGAAGDRPYRTGHVA